MICFYHPEMAAVAQCGHGCGRALCLACARSFGRPECLDCQSAVMQAQAQAVREPRATLKRKIAINIGMLTIYALILIAPQAVPLWMGLPMFAWGFWGFRWLLNALLEVTGMAFFAGLQEWFIIYAVGSLLCSLFSPFVIPFLLALQVWQFKRLPAVAAV